MSHQQPQPSRKWHVLLAGAVVALGLALVSLAGRDFADAGGGGNDRPSTGPAESLAGDAAPPEPTVWREDYAAALGEAAEKNLPVLVRFTASWCPPCQVMDARVFPDARVRSAIAGRVIPVMIDVDRESSQDLARRYRVSSIPTLILTDAGGKELARGGFMSAEQLVEFLRR